MTLTDKSKDNRKGIDIKRARREIIKFGMSGFDVQKKQKAKVALAVSLGILIDITICFHHMNIG